MDLHQSAKRLLLAAVLLSSLIAGSASAALLEGSCLKYQYYLGALGTSVYDPPEILCPAVDYEIVHNAATLSITDTKIVMRWHSTTSYNTDTFNGFQLSDIYGTIPAFSAFSIDGISNLGGFNASRVFLEADSIALNFSSLWFTPSTVLSITLRGAEVSEPSSVTLLLVALSILLDVTLRASGKERVDPRHSRH